LSAISVFSDRVGVRLLIAASVLVIASIAGLAVVVGLKLCTSVAIPGWATYTSGLLLIVMLQLLTSMALFVFGVLGDRTPSRFLPARDHVHSSRRSYPSIPLMADKTYPGGPSPAVATTAGNGPVTRGTMRIDPSTPSWSWACCCRWRGSGARASTR
jgi:hypothetical protein